jgi:hypothetical protein
VINQYATSRTQAVVGALQQALCSGEAALCPLQNTIPIIRKAGEDVHVCVDAHSCTVQQCCVRTCGSDEFACLHGSKAASNAHLIACDVDVGGSCSTSRCCVPADDGDDDDDGGDGKNEKKRMIIYTLENGEITVWALVGILIIVLTVALFVFNYTQDHDLLFTSNAAVLQLRSHS